MRRYRDRPPSTLFRGNELPRLATMIVMLGVLWLLIDRAGDANTWRWLAADGEPPAAATLTAEVPSDDVSPSGPTDEDPEEQDAIREEFQAVTDKRPLAPEEMPAYWRLMAWDLRQSTSAMRDRADQQVTFNQLWQRPDAWRGKLIEIPMHLRRTLRQDDVAENQLGLKTVYEVWGWNSDSQPYWYWIITPKLPPRMPEGPSIYEEATFVGYFFKLLPYEDHEGKHLATPLLIGRLVWHPEQPSPLAHRNEWVWPWILGGVLGGLLAVRWGVSYWKPSWANRQSLGERAADVEAVAEWLEGIEREKSSQDAQHDIATNGDSHRSAENAGPPDQR